MKKPRKKAVKKPAKGADTTEASSLSSLVAMMKACDSPEERLRRTSIQAVGNNLQEHLGCFILIGYTLDGDPVQMTYAPTPQDMDSLGTGLHRFVYNIGGL